MKLAKIGNIIINLDQIALVFDHGNSVEIILNAIIDNNSLIIEFSGDDRALLLAWLNKTGIHELKTSVNTTLPQIRFGRCNFETDKNFKISR